MTKGPIWQDNQSAYLTQLALEMNVDSIFHICSNHSGFHGGRRLPNARERAANKKTNDRITASAKYKKLMAAFRAEVPIMQKRINDELAKINAARKKKGLPPKILKNTNIEYRASKLGLKWNNPMPRLSQLGSDMKEFYPINAKEMKSHFGQVVQELYTKKKKRIPSINVILLLAGDEEIPRNQEKNINEFARIFKGKLRTVKGLNKISSR